MVTSNIRRISNELDAVVGDGHGSDKVKPLKLFEKIIRRWCRLAAWSIDEA
jgi:hypothetical protein